ncbi:MAG TPA: SDR family oxidoreductase, partial [Gammaproteobacteria bacterium]|nr:SDR family oxidoreductase [Gammaproteobacteria bacterium]
MIPDNKGNRILVVGGSGFIGSHVVPRAISMGMDVTFTGTHENKPGLASGEAEYICLDTTDRDAVYHALHGRQFEYVVNCGGYINHAGIHDGGYQVTREHFYSVVNLIEAIPRDSLQCFVNLGSSDEYGSCSAPQRENMREQAISPYSAAKLAATHFLQMLWHSEEFPAVTLRLFLVYGPGQGENRFLP